jgi:hypothetical protein
MPEKILYDDCKIVDDGVNQYLQMGLDFGVFPQKTTAEINILLPTKSRFVFDSTLNVLKIGNGTSFDIVNTEPVKSYLDWVVEDFVTTSAGSAINFSANIGAGGSLSTEIPEQQPNWNGTIPYARLGQNSCRITTAPSARIGNATSNNYRLFSTAKFGFASEQSIIGGQIDFATDPTLLCWGFLDNFGASAPANGIYFRPPRVGETAFLKYVVRAANIETIFDTIIPYDANNRRFVRTALFWDGTNMSFVCTDGTTASLNTISNLLTTFAALATINFSYGMLVGRNGTASLPIARNLNTDRVEKYYKSVYA